MKLAALNLFRSRNILVVVLALGLLLGIWLGDLFKGFGWGPGAGTGTTSPSSPGNSAAESSHGIADLVGHRTETSNDESASEVEVKPGEKGVVKVLIDDRNYFLRTGGKKQLIGLESLVQLIEHTQPDEDGLRAIIDRTPSSRATAELKLFDALKDAGVPANSVYLAPKAVE